MIPAAWLTQHAFLNELETLRVASIHSIQPANWPQLPFWLTCSAAVKECPRTSCRSDGKTPLGFTPKDSCQ